MGNVFIPLFRAFTSLAPEERTSANLRRAFAEERRALNGQRPAQQRRAPRNAQQRQTLQRARGALTRRPSRIDLNAAGAPGITRSGINIG